MNKIDLIIENIEYAKLVTEQSHKDELLDEALAAARELKELKPVASAWLLKNKMVNAFPHPPRDGWDHDGYWAAKQYSKTPLYALEVTK